MSLDNPDTTLIAEPDEAGSLGHSRRLVGVSYAAAPLLMALAAGLYVADVGVSPAPFDDGSWVEGVVGVFALIAFVPVYLALAHRLASYRPRLAGVLRVTGLVGAVSGVVWESLRVFSQAMVRAGMTPDQAETFLDEQIALSWPLTVSVLFPLTSIGLGLGFVRGGLPRWQALALAGGGAGFVTAQALAVGIDVTYPVGAALWSVALVPLSVATLRRRAASPAVGDVTFAGRYPVGA